MIILLLIFSAGEWWYLQQNHQIKSDTQLLKPVFTIDKNSKLIKDLKDFTATFFQKNTKRNT